MLTWRKFGGGGCLCPALLANPCALPPLPCSGGKLLKRLSNFQKTVTCVRLSPLAGPEAAAAPRMLVGSLDGHVKVFELNDFKVSGWVGKEGQGQGREWQPPSWVRGGAAAVAMRV